MAFSDREVVFGPRLLPTALGIFLGGMNELTHEYAGRPRVLSALS